MKKFVFGVEFDFDESMVGFDKEMRRKSSSFRGRRKKVLEVNDFFVLSEK